MKEEARWGAEKFTYGGFVFIYNPQKNLAITSYPSTDGTGKSTGTRFAKPVVLDEHSFGSPAERIAREETHRLVTRRASVTRSTWRSHSVLIVDMSGSMRRDDVNGARCRSDGVWLCLARDYVKQQLSKGLRDSNDKISIIIMRDKAEVLVNCEPTTWVLYNTIIKLRQWTELKPSGPGNYLPALDLAEKLLASNTSPGCALSLLFFSDGKPSDPTNHRPQIVEKVSCIVHVWSPKQERDASD